MSRPVDSAKTAEARRRAKTADAEYRAHVADCPACTRATRTRTPTIRCAEGAAAYTDRRDRKRELDHNRELDRQPIAGQEPLF